MSVIGRLRKSLRLDAEIGDELAFHIDEKTRELIERGMSPASARAAALRAFGNPGAIQERTRDADTFAWLDAVRRNLTIAIRSLGKRKGLAVTSILSLAIGIGASTALFSFADPIFFRPLPLPHPEELIAIVETIKGLPFASNPLRMAQWASEVPGLSGVGGSYSEGVVLTGEGTPVRLQTLRTFGPLLAVLGERPAVGRAFSPAEERAIGEPVALISWRLWKTRYHGEPIGSRVLRLGGVATAVIGVLRKGQQYPEAVDIISPAPPQYQKTTRRAGFVQLVARLKPGVSRQQVQVQLKTVARRMAQQFPVTDGNRDAHAEGLREQAGIAARRPVLLLFSMAALVLLIACVNVASLLLARAAERQREIAIRVALGAGRGSLLAHYLAESFVLSAAGGLTGLMLGKLGLMALLRFLPKGLDLPAPARFDWRVALFGLGAALLSGLFFGLAPAWQAAFAARFGSSAANLRGGTRATASSGGLWMRRLLVGSQVALSVVLLIAVGLAAKSLYNVRTAPLGFEPASVLTMQVNFSWDTPQARLESFSGRVLEELQATPGVMAAGMVDRLPMGGGTQSGPVGIRSVALPPELQDKQVDQRMIKGDYFRAVGVALRAGREPRPRSGKSGARELLVNETFARRYFPDGSALGHFVTTNPKPNAGEDADYFEIVGIVDDVRVAPTQTEQPAEIFLLSRETFWPYQNYAIRVAGDPAAMARAAREAVRRVDPNQLIDKVATMRDEVLDSSSDQQTRLWLLGGFGFAALVLAAIGLYGVLASDVAQRTNEIGIRMALGAQPNRIQNAMVGRGLLITAAGAIAGLACASALGRLVISLLYGVEPGDPIVLAGVVALLACVAALASYVPARRAAKVDPVVALRHE